MAVGEIIKEKDIETYNKLMKIGKGKSKHEANYNSKQNRKNGRKY